ncbi:hypothetical protein ROHU_004709 [Labeo rohita]|uniref:Uncharacterized protein n=1 Tax=Labeo rohita TaxID=84645 RepID=A0A498NJS1_LABRO|nr:hypothetical protein ROHU_004709 [Labeo rohita]
MLLEVPADVQLHQLPRDLAALESLSPDQKAELLLDPSTGAIENVTVVKEVLSSILNSRDEEQLEKFFETFVETKNVLLVKKQAVLEGPIVVLKVSLCPPSPLRKTSPISPMQAFGTQF